MIDADYTGEVKVIMMNHGKKDYQVPERDRIAQMIIERIDMSEMMEVDNLRITNGGSKGFWSPDLSPKRTIVVKQVQPVMCQLYVESRENTLFRESDIGRNPWLLREEVLLARPKISKALLQEYKPQLLEEVQNATRNNLEWLAREAMLKDLLTHEKEMPTNW